MGATGSHSFRQFTQICASGTEFNTAIRHFKEKLPRLQNVQRKRSFCRSVFLLPSLHTWVVPAASGRAASPPLPLIQRGAPLLQLAVLQRVGRQVAELQAGELAQEVTERHPGG